MRETVPSTTAPTSSSASVSSSYGSWFLVPPRRIRRGRHYPIGPFSASTDSPSPVPGAGSAAGGSGPGTGQDQGRLARPHHAQTGARQAFDLGGVVQARDLQAELVVLRLELG